LAVRATARRQAGYGGAGVTDRMLIFSERHLPSVLAE
jgi:hypothetical protein